MHVFQLRPPLPVASSKRHQNRALPKFRSHELAVGNSRLGKTPNEMGIDYRCETRHRKAGSGRKKVQMSLGIPPLFLLCLEHKRTICRLDEFLITQSELFVLLHSFVYSPLYSKD